MAVDTEERDAAIELNEEREGGFECSEDFFFTKIGESVPLKAENSSFDLGSHPAQPLAVSESSEAVFVAHSEGFYVAKTRDVVEAAKELGKKKSGVCVQELCVVDVPIGQVHVLALSSDSSTLAACVGSQIHFYNVSAILNKERDPCFSCSVNESSHVKDFHWRKNLGTSYTILSKSGVLYSGKVDGKLKEVMDNVDAVDWSVKGNNIVVARENVLTVLSSKFRERLSMSLMSSSWVNGSDSQGNVKVDCIKWVRPDCILLGCFRLAENGAEEGYFVQIISSKNGKIAKTASESVVLSFGEVFPGIIDDILPCGSGPYLSLSYLEHWGLAFVANQKNTEQHIVLFGWSLNDDQKEGAVIELAQEDRWLPRIGLQENEDDNLIMGLTVDKVSLYEKVMVNVGYEQKELPPFCLLLCLTLEGKLAMFYVSSVTENQVLPKIIPELSEEEEDNVEAVPLGDDTSDIALRSEEHELKETGSDTNWQELTIKGDRVVVVGNENPVGELNSCLDSSSKAAVSNRAVSSGSNVSCESFGKTQGSSSLSVLNAGQKTQSHSEVPKKDEQSDGNLGVKSRMPGQQSPSLEKPKNSSFLSGFYSVTENQVLPKIIPELSEEEEDNVEAVPLGDDTSDIALRSEEHELKETVLDTNWQELTIKGDRVVVAGNKNPVGELNSCLDSSFNADVSNKAVSSGSNVSSESFGKTQGSLSLSVLNAGQKTQSHSEVPKKDEQSDGNLGVKSWMPGQQSPSLEKPKYSSFLRGFDSAYTVSGQSEAQKPFFPQTKTDSPTMPLSSPFELNSEVPLGRGDTVEQFPGRIDPISSRGASSGLQSSRNVFSSDEPKVRSASLSLSSTVVNQFENSEPGTRNNVHASGSQASFDLPHGNLSKTKEPTSIFHPLTYSSSLGTNSGQRYSAGVLKFESAPAAQSSKVSSHGNSQNFKLQPAQENLSSAKPSSLSTAEREISKHFASVRDMAKELDTLLSYIEEEGGFRDASTIFNKSSILALEGGLENLSGRCRLLKSTMENRHEEIRVLLDKTVQVMARTTYLEGIFKRVSDNQYRDLWYRQKLSPELELKQKRMLKLNQDLTNQLVQLERHFNSLEVNRFIESSGGCVSRRVSHTSQEPSRRNQSVQSLYSTTNSQLAAAEHLSECLSKQMSSLNIESHSVKKQNVAKELFDSIGLDYSGDSFKSPVVKNVGHSQGSDSKSHSYSSSFAITNQSGSRRPSLTNGSELESTRRSRDSLDQNWANFEPSKTTIKRLSLQEERIRTKERDSFLMRDKQGFTSPLQPGVDNLQDHITSRHLDSSIAVHELNKVGPVHDLECKSSKHPSAMTSYFNLAGGSAGQLQDLESKSTALQVSQRNGYESYSSVVPFQSTPNEFQEKASEAWGSIDNYLNIEGNFGGRSDFSKSQSVPFLKLTSDFHPKTPQDQTPTTSTRFPAQRATSPMKFPDETSLHDSFNLKGGASQTKTSVPVEMNSGNTLDLPIKSQPSPFPAVSTFLPVPTSDVNSFQLGTVTSKSHGNTFISASSASSPGTSSSSLQQHPSLSSTPFLSSTVMSFGGSMFSTTKPSTGAFQTVPSPMSSSSSSGPLFTSIPNKQVSPLCLSASMSTTLQGESGSKQAVNTASQASEFQLEFRGEELSSDLAVSTTPTTDSKITARLESGNKSSFTNLFGASPVPLNSQPDLPSATQVQVLEHHSSPITATDEKNENLDLAVAQEDEMEEEAPDSSSGLNLGSLGGFNLGSAPTSSALKPNPFGVSIQNTAGNPTSAFTSTVPSGEMFRPASFSFHSVQPSQPAITMNQNAFSGGFSSVSSAQGPGGSSFGQPAQLGSAQQVMGSVLGGFGQSRQLGMVTEFTSATGFGGGFPAPSSGGFVNAATGGGFASLRSAGGGFAASASSVTGFAAASASGSAGGGFGAFGNKQGSGGFSAYGSSSMEGGKPPPGLLTQMRK